jgi:membrane-bound lytic murein transglycosylase B
MGFMGRVGRPAHRAGLGGLRCAAALLTAALLTGCTAEEGAHLEPATDRSASATVTPPREVTGRSGSAAALARRLERAAATLRARDVTATQVRRAGQLQQLAVHTLATSSDQFRRQVQSRLPPETALDTRDAVRATRLLRALTDPAPRLPRWRIVAPPPPMRLRGYYHRAQRRTGVPWTYLAAIHLVETRMGRIRGPSTAGARGPMQFLPSTWELYGGRGDINDPRDAILAAARLLADHGAPADMAGALWHYNPSGNYVRAVSAFAHTMQRSRSAYRGYWHWRVLYRYQRGTYVLPVGYPDARPVPLR